MQRSFKDVLLEILDIIKYPNDKEKFVAEFEVMNHTEAILNLLDQLPTDVQAKIKASNLNKEEVNKHISQELYLSEITKVSKNALVKFLEAVSPILNLDQKQKITQLVKQQ
ncbi:MAG TPA: hypothetical protein VE090_03465 [Methylomirabilota bacterium]|nr:hypothetical protein [Methylomirabilota bacterium]